MDRKGKHVSIRVQFLDGQVHVFQIHTKAYGSVLWDAVVKHLNLVEADYFDLQFADRHGLQSWLDREKHVLKQLPSPDTPVYFYVKFYTPDPALLEDEHTRYLFAQQIKRDLQEGSLTCSDNTMALLASYIAQAEVGDYPMDEFTDHTYLRANNLKYLPKQTEELEKKIMEYHRQHVGETPAEADVNLLDTARKVELYGIRLLPAKDHEGVSLNLAVSHCGILVFQGLTKINTFSWAKIRKLSFKRKRLLIKLHPENYGYYKDLVEFFFETRDECKSFWKKCIEHHGFFRCHKVKKLARNKTRVVSHGSSFRYSGKTQKELSEFIRESFTGKRSTFERTVSGRISSSRSSSVTPKIPAKVSLHNSDIHNSTASSGSHILDHSLPGNHLSNEAQAADHTDARSESSVSGSRSLNSPKPDHFHSESDTATPRHSAHSSTVIENEHLDRPDGTKMSHPHEDEQVPERVLPPIPLPSPKSPPANLPPRSPNKMSDMGRKYSAPVFGIQGNGLNLEDPHLSRTSEIENIPETVREDEEDPRLSFSLSVTKSPRHSLTNGQHNSHTQPELYTEDTEDFDTSINQPHYDDSVGLELSGDHYPPPPPPPLPSDLDSALRSSAGALHSNISTLSETRTEGSEDSEKRKTKVSKRYPVDRAYYIAKELLMTERTYKKDLEVITLWFKNAIAGDDAVPDYLEEMFRLLEPIYQFHLTFLPELEQRLTMWEGRSNAHLNGDHQRIGDIMVTTFLSALGPYMNYLEKQDDILLDLERAQKTSKEFELAYHEFETQKVCYLPLNTFLLKPGQRLLHYKLLLERLTRHYSKSHPDYMDCHATLTKLTELTQTYRSQRKCVENLQKLIELQKDLVGIESIVHPDREFLREGCLQKFSRKGYQQRMFFLFSDMLVYTSRTATPMLQFKVHGQVPLRGMIIEESDHAKMAVANSFAIYGGNKCILVAASTQEEKDKWIEDLKLAVEQAKNRTDDKLKYASLKSSTSSTENVEAAGNQGPPSPEKQIQHRANTTMHVCWHRNTSVCRQDHEKAIKNQLSGYLLRKFKNSNGWQKLWVVFTNFCLYFYKTYQEDFPLASLPLLGYAVSQPEEDDNIHKDHVFKLQFKNHIYFFRAESEYTFERWMEVINSATSSARRTRLFSRMDSRLDSMHP